MRTRILAISIASAAAVTLAACSSTDTTPGVSPTGAAPATTAPSAPAAGAPSTRAPSRHNQADVQFNRMMIPHHRQAVQMADMVEGHTGNPQLLGLAKEIAAAQQPEIDQMTARLNSWGVPPTSETHGEHQGHSMAGMMSDQQMHQLSTLHGAAFDHQWLTMMIAHHEGAIAMAKTELASGADPASKQLANSIIAGQQKEIDRMQAILGQ